MRRNRGMILHPLLFLLALGLIIWSGSGPSEPTKVRIFAWSKVRYETRAKTLPPTRGVCPGLSSMSKPALVVARMSSEDSSWLTSSTSGLESSPPSRAAPLTDLYHLCAYTADAPRDSRSNKLQTPSNRGHEAMAYLTFIIDNYATLPKAGMVFVHGSRFQWHNDHPMYDNLRLLRQLDLPRALEGEGYHNLRCDWSTSMCPPETARPQGSVETRARAALEHGNSRAVSDAALPAALLSIFGAEGRMLGRADAVRAQCCAQFVVARENVWRHSREEYVALRQWLLDGAVVDDDSDDVRVQKQKQKPVGDGKTDGSNNINSNQPAPADDLVAGRILSYVWHILFLPTSSSGVAADGKGGDGDAGVDLTRLNNLACPSAADCYCRLFGLCDLKGCDSPARCRGMYRVPPDYKLPGDWADTHG